MVFNLGLWREYFDVNAIDKLQGPQFCYPDAELQHDSVILPDASLISVCSMNMQFRREVIPAVYQLPMHVEVMPGWVIDRYGDIWGGFILKTLMDLRGDRMAAGGPMIRHLAGGFISEISGRSTYAIWSTTSSCRSSTRRALKSNLRTT